MCVCVFVRARFNECVRVRQGVFFFSYLFWHFLFCTHALVAGFLFCFFFPFSSARMCPRHVDVMEDLGSPRRPLPT